MARQQAARFTTKYSRAEKDALLKAVLIDGLSVREAMRRARQGLLGTPPFGSAGDFGYSLIRYGRDEFEARNDEALERGTRDTLRELHIANLKAARALGPDASTTDRARAAKDLAETARTMGAGQPKRAAKQKPVNGQAEQDAPLRPDGTLGELLDLAGNDKAPHDGGAPGPAVGAAA